MDKRTVIGFILILAILLAWPYLTRLIYGPPPPPEQPQDTTIVSATEEPAPDTFEKTEIVPAAPIPIDTAMAPEVTVEPERTITIETKNLVYTLSSRGGTITEIILKNYLKYDSSSVSLIGNHDGPEWAEYGALTLGYADSLPHFNNDNFRLDGYNYVLSENEPTRSVTFTYNRSDDVQIIKRYTFQYEDYLFDIDIDIKRPQKLGMGQGVTVGWFAPMETTEENPDHDKTKLGGFFNMGGDFDYFKDLKDGKLRKIATGPVEWIATRTKYFTAVVMAETSPAEEVIVVGNRAEISDSEGNSHEWNRFGVGMTYERPPEELSLRFSVYTGPLDYYRLNNMGKRLSSLVDMGWKPFRPFSIAILWIFTSLHKAIPNYGFVIIVFSILMKLVFWPLSLKSAKSMHKMREIQPKIQEVKEKFKNDPARLNKETMKLYKEHGFNPFGSCLPMLIQLPIFWALYSVLGNTIEIRGADFILWITDLSRPDPTGKYFFVGVLPIIMGISMFIQQKMTITDPKQKMMVYFMPILFTFLFSRWASGLVLYWTMFNIMGIFEQWFVKRKMAEEKVT
jgi:YidC/Oxa1 family membrane protein insertase